MPTIRLPHSPRIDRELADRVREEFGVGASIVSTHEVRVGGFYGFFARRYVEATVELPLVHATPVTRPGAESRAEPRAEYGADDFGRGGAPLPMLSTDSPAFAQILEEIAHYAGLPGYDRVRTEPPPFRTGMGNLVTVAGLGTDAAVAVRVAFGSIPAVEFYVGGDSSPRGRHIDNHRGANAARADSAAVDSSAVIAYGLGTGPANLWRHLRVLKTFGTDQLWLVVDPSRKPEDTAAWVSAIREEIDVDGLIVITTMHTATPNTVRALGLPELWADPVG